MSDPLRKAHARVNEALLARLAAAGATSMILATSALGASVGSRQTDAPTAKAAEVGGRSPRAQGPARAPDMGERDVQTPRPLQIWGNGPKWGNWLNR